MRAGRAARTFSRRWCAPARGGSVGEVGEASPKAWIPRLPAWARQPRAAPLPLSRATSPTVSSCFLVRTTKLAEDVQILSRAKRGRHPRGQGPCRKNGSILMFYDTCREAVIALNRSAVLGTRSSGPAIVGTQARGP